jgi:hypothetical protein
MRKPSKPRNAYALALQTNKLFRTKFAPTPEEKEIKRDVWAKNTRHKGKKSDALSDDDDL